MDERWSCPKCGFKNESCYAYCVSCDANRPSASPNYADIAGKTEAAADAERPVARSAPTGTRSVIEPSEVSDCSCAICGRKPAKFFRFRATIGLVIIRRDYSYEDCLCRVCALGKFRQMQGRSLAWGWFGLLSFAHTIGYAFSNLRECREKRRGMSEPTPPFPDRDKKLAGRPVIVRALPGLAVVAVMVFLIIGLIASSMESDAIRPYVDSLEAVNNMRNQAINLSNSRYDVWMRTSPDLIPSSNYLVNKELVSLLASAKSMDTPGTDALRELHEAWLSSLEELVTAEQLLADAPTQENYDNDMRAWFAEHASFTPLLDYCNSRR